MDKELNQYLAAEVPEGWSVVNPRYMAELKKAEAENERLHGRLADSERTITELSERMKRREAKLAKVRKLAESWESEAVAEEGPCPDDSCGACTKGNLSHLLLTALDE